jgi:hypothetical protein
MAGAGGRGMTRPRLKWTEERDALLRELRASDIGRLEMLDRINEGFDHKATMVQMQEHARRIGAKRPARIAAKHDYAKTGPRFLADDAYRAMSHAFARALRAARVRFQTIRFDPPQTAPIPHRRGIMSGPPPDLDRLIEARAQMARQGRMAVVDVGVRGLV